MRHLRLQLPALEGQDRALPPGELELALRGALEEARRGGEGEPTPWLEEDFSTYSNTADLLSDPRGIYSTAEDSRTSQMVLDKTTGVNINGLHLAQSLRFDYIAPGCVTQTVNRNMNLPAAVADVWVEVYMKFSANFTTRSAGGCGTPSDFKTIFGRLRPDGFCRFELHVGGASGGTGFAVGAAGCGNGVGSFHGSEFGDATTVWDDRWHRYRFHWKVGSPDGENTAYEFWLDDQLMFQRMNFNAGGAPQIYGLALGRNLDQGIVSGIMSLWWGRVRAWNSDPAW